MAAVAAGAVVLAGCGGQSTRTSADCTVTLYLGDSATQSQVDAARRRLETDPRVVRVKFVSKEEALRRLRKRFPELVANLTYNPLPDALEVTVAESDSTEVVDDFRPHPAGVENMKGCSSSAQRVIQIP